MNRADACIDCAGIIDCDEKPMRSEWIGWISVLGYFGLCGLVYLLH